MRAIPQHTCSVNDCENKIRSRGFCAYHYNQWRSGSDYSLLSESDELFKCSVELCETLLPLPYGKHKYCRPHYQRWKRHGDPLYERQVTVGVAKCSIDGCEKIVQARGWCSAHLTRWYRHGSPTARLAGEVVNGKRICPTCDIDKPLNEWTKGECKECSRKRSQQYKIRNPYEPVKIRRVCTNCNEPFWGNNKRKLHCSKECSNATYGQRNWKHMKARQMRHKTSFVEKFDRLEIFERDNWICGICNEPVDPSLKHPDRMSASLDHIIPISRGGTHSRDNAQCSHWICNMRKGAKVPV